MFLICLILTQRASVWQLFSVYELRQMTDKLKRALRVLLYCCPNLHQGPSEICVLGLGTTKELFIILLLNEDTFKIKE